MTDLHTQDPDTPFSAAFAAELCSSLEPLGIGATTLAELLGHIFDQFATFSALHAEMQVTYVLQPRQGDAYQAGSKEIVVGTEVVQYDHEWVDGCVKYALGFWLGVRETSAASWDERFKCRYCPYSDACSRKPQPPQPQLGLQREQLALKSELKGCADDEFDDMDEIFASLPDELLR
eukprot:COSAG02_NODE_16344_length_1091_cov_1.032258_1_plen_177_part_00